MKINVLKFGGSSMEHLDKIKEIILNTQDKKIIVLSAIKNLTNSLLKIVNNDDLEYNFNKILKIINFTLEKYHFNIKYFNDILQDFYSNVNELKMNPSYDLKTKIIFFGERFSTTLLKYYLAQDNIKCCKIDGTKVIRSKYAINRLNEIKMNISGGFECLSEIFNTKINNHNIFVVEGFISSIKGSKFNCILTRGGSDTTSSLIASDLKNKFGYDVKLQIWTDVNGMFDIDPNLGIKSKLLKEIDYDSAQEMAANGCKVMHPYSIIPCQKSKIEIEIRNTFDREGNFTTINNSNKFIKAIGITKKVNIFKITSLDMWENAGFVHDIFSVFKMFNVDVNIITTSQFSVHVTTEENNKLKLDEINNHLIKKKYCVELIRDCVIISLISNKLNLICIKKFLSIDKIIMRHFSANGKNVSIILEKDNFLKEINNIYSFIS